MPLLRVVGRNLNQSARRALILSVRQWEAQGSSAASGEIPITLTTCGRPRILGCLGVSFPRKTSPFIQLKCRGRDLLEECTFGGDDREASCLGVAGEAGKAWVFAVSEQNWDTVKGLNVHGVPEGSKAPALVGKGDYLVFYVAKRGAEKLGA